jgi:hypothetical protein
MTKQPSPRPKCSWYEENGTLVVKVEYRGEVWSYFFQVPFHFIKKILKRMLVQKNFNFHDWNKIKKHSTECTKERS